MCQDVRMVVSIPQEWGKSALPGLLPPWRPRMPGSDMLRMGARRPSGRPGTRWLRVDRKPLSTERPGPTRVTPPRPDGTSLVVARALGLAPSDGVPVRHTVPDPAALGRRGGDSPVGGPGVAGTE